MNVSRSYLKEVYGTHCFVLLYLQQLILLSITTAVGFVNYVVPSAVLHSLFSLLTAVHGILIAVTFMIRKHALVLWSGILCSDKRQQKAQEVP